jgi:hypothetical protein
LAYLDLDPLLEGTDATSDSMKDQISKTLVENDIAFFKRFTQSRDVSSREKLPKDSILIREGFSTNHQAAHRAPSRAECLNQLRY